MSSIPLTTAAAAVPMPGRPLNEFPALAGLAFEHLGAFGTVLRFAPEEARQVVARMRLVNFPSGATLLREGEREQSEHLLLLLSGDVSVSTAQSRGSEPVPISVLGAGHLIGEMALLDGEPHSASCVAVSSVTAAALTLAGLLQLLDEHPRAAAKLLAVIAIGVSERLRAMNDQLHMLSGLSGR